MAELRYYEPTTLTEAVSFLAAHPGEARVVAGATDVLVEMRLEGLAPRHLMNINKLAYLSYIRDDDGGLALGALTRIRDLETSALVRKRFPGIAEAAAQFGSVQIRNLATLGGNLAHAAPSAEMAPPLLVSDAQVKLVGPAGERRVALTDFFTGPGATVMAPDEILAEVQLPAPARRGGTAYLRHCVREALDIAIVNVGASVVLADGRVQAARIALGAVAPTPFRARRAEAALTGRRLDDGALAQAGRLAAEETQPISDVRASADYRRAMAEVLTSRALELAGRRAGA